MTAPKTIYLQWCDCKDAEVTWCVDQVAEDGQADIEYIRSDISDGLLEACEELVRVLTEPDYHEDYLMMPGEDRAVKKAQALIAKVRGE